MEHHHSTKIQPTGTRYICPMHPEIVQDKPGNCPKCGMNLVKVEKPTSISEPEIIATAEIAEISSLQHQLQKYTCPMHPHILRDGPGKCPICGMNLEPVAGGDYGSILKTMDGGNTWTSLVSATWWGINWSSVYFTDINTGYVVGSGGTILKTTNGGATFTTEIASPESSFILYPNPATNTITIDTKRDWPGETITNIFSLNGELIRRDKFQNQEKIEIDVNSLTSGMYFVEIRTEAGKEIKKLVIR